MKRGNLFFIVAQFMLSIILVLFLIARSKGLHTAIFWPIIIFQVITSFYIVHRLPEKFKIMSLALLSVSISLILITVLPNIYNLGRDGVFEAEYADEITALGRWEPTLGVGFAENYYGYHPGLHFILSFFSSITGLSSYFLIKFVFFVVLRLFLSMLVFIVMMELLGKKRALLAYLSTFVFIGSSGLSFVGVTRRSTAGIFVMLSVYSLLKSHSSKGNRLWNGLFMLFSFMLVLADRSIATYFALFLFLGWIFSKLAALLPNFKSIGFPKIGWKLLFFIIIFLSWKLFVANVTIGEDINYFDEIRDLLMSGFRLSLFFDLRNLHGDVNYRAYEVFIIYSSQILFLLIGFAGLLVYVIRLLRGQDEKFQHPLFLLYIALFCFSMYSISSAFMLTHLDVAVIIILWFFCMPICIFVSYSSAIIAGKVKNKRIFFYAASFVFIYLFAGSLMMGIFTPRIVNRFDNEDIVIGWDDRSKTKELFYAGSWLSRNAPGGSRILGDPDVYETVGGFFKFDVSPSPIWLKYVYLGDNRSINEVISTKAIDFGAYRHTFRLNNVDYIVINNAFTRFKSILFGDKLNYGRTDYLDGVSMLDKHYSNGEIRIYRIGR